MNTRMTPERLEEIRELLHVCSRAWTPAEIVTKPLFGIAEELVLMLETERARMDWLGTSRVNHIARTVRADGIPHIRLTDTDRGAVRVCGIGEDLRSAIDAAREREKGAAS